MPAASEDPAAPRQEGDGGARRGRAGFRAPAPPDTRPPARRGEQERRGSPAGRMRRAVPFTMNVRPSTHHGSVAARESVTSPHRSGEDPERGGDGGRPHQSRRANQTAVGRPAPLRGWDGGQPQGRGGRLTRTARSQRGRGCRNRPGCPQRGGRARAEGSPHRPFSPPHPGGSEETRAQGGTGEPGHSDGRVREARHTGPSRRAAQARAGPANQVTETPENPLTHPEARPLQQRDESSRQRTACQQ